MERKRQAYLSNFSIQSLFTLQSSETLSIVIPAQRGTWPNEVRKGTCCETETQYTTT